MTSEWSMASGNPIWKRNGGNESHLQQPGCKCWMRSSPFLPILNWLPFSYFSFSVHFIMLLFYVRRMGVCGLKQGTRCCLSSRAQNSLTVNFSLPRKRFLQHFTHVESEGCASCFMWSHLITEIGTQLWIQHTLVLMVWWAGFLKRCNRYNGINSEHTSFCLLQNIKYKRTWNEVHMDKGMCFLCSDDNSHCLASFESILRGDLIIKDAQ